MPRAVVNPEETERYDLETCPEGYVVLRRMSYGQWLKRQEMALNLKIEAGKGSKDTSGEMAMANRKVTEFEFQNSIVEHNLEDDGGNLLDFRQSHTFDLLDPRIGNEIGDRITKLHEFLSSESLGN